MRRPYCIHLVVSLDGGKAKEALGCHCSYAYNDEHL